jgi:hypothetical protein
MDTDLQEVVDHIGAELELLLPTLGLKLPEGVSGAQFLTGVLNGIPGIERDPALFSWFGVKILNANAGDLHPDLAAELSARIALVAIRDRGAR